MDGAGLNQLRGKYARALELLQTSLQEKDTAERRAEKSEAECQHHKKKHEQSVKQVSELTAQLTDATQELEKLRTLIDANKELEETRKILAESQKKVEEYRQQTKEKDETIITLKKRLQHVNQDSASLESRNKELQERLDQQSESYEEEISKLNSQIAAMQQTISNQENTIADLNDRISQADTRNEVLYQQLRRAKQEKSKAVNDFEELKKQSKQQSHDYAELRRQYDFVEDRSTNLENALIHLQRKLEEVQKTRMGSKFSEFVKVKRENHKLHDQVDALSKIAKEFRDPYKRMTRGTASDQSDEEAKGNPRRRPILRKPQATQAGRHSGDEPVDASPKSNTFISQRQIGEDSSKEPSIRESKTETGQSSARGGKTEQGQLGSYGTAIIQG